MILWGFTAGIVARLFEYLGWTSEVADAPMRDLPDYMLQGEPTITEVNPTPDSRSASEPARLAAGRAGPGLRVVGLLAGFVTGAFATGAPGGRPLRGLAGAEGARDATPSLLVSLGALFIVILSASLGQAVAQFTGAKIRDRITWQPIRALDAVGGAALSAAAVLLVAWALGVAVSGTRLGGITPMVRGSAVLKEVDHVLPESAGGVLQAFNDVVGTSFFPATSSRSPPSASSRSAGPRRLLQDPDVVDAGDSVVKIRGTNECGRGIEAPASSTPRTG